MSDWRNFQIRVHGSADRPTLIYLPGLHGDWTLVGSYRVALGDRVRFVEVTYPRTVTWSIEDHVSRLLEILGKHGISEGWLLAESFGSVLAWALVERQAAFKVRGIILAGGFVRYPYAAMVRMARMLNRAIPLWCIRVVCWFYGRYALLRHRHARETLTGVAEFVRRRSEEADRAAICYRYDLILGSDARGTATRLSVPVHQLCGLVDPIVPWFPVRVWLKRHCPANRDWRLVWRADHNVLGTAPQVAAEQVVSWIRAVERRE